MSKCPYIERCNSNDKKCKDKKKYKDCKEFKKFDEIDKSLGDLEFTDWESCI